MAKDPHNDTSKKNIKALTQLLIKGKVVAKDEVVKKSDFPNKSDWQNLCHTEPPRAEETADDVGKPKAEKPPAKGGKKGGGMPGT